jgi:hypothetical protein
VGSLVNLKLLRSYGGRWLPQLKAQRHVDPARTGNRPLGTVPLAPHGSMVHLNGDGVIKVVRIVPPDGDTEHWATTHLELSEWERVPWARQVWTIKDYHRGLNQCCGGERAQVRAARAARFCAWSIIGS